MQGEGAVTVQKKIILVDMQKMEKWTEEERKDMEINSKAMKTLICALFHEEFNRISTCKTTKEIWDKLKVTH